MLFIDKLLKDNEVVLEKIKHGLLDDRIVGLTPAALQHKEICLSPAAWLDDRIVGLQDNEIRLTPAALQHNEIRLSPAAWQANRRSPWCCSLHCCYVCHGMKEAKEDDLAKVTCRSCGSLYRRRKPDCSDSSMSHRDHSTPSSHLSG